MLKRIIKYAMPITGAVMMALMPALPVLADTYEYTVNISVAETSGTAYSNIQILTGIKGTNLNSVGMMEADGLDTRVKEGTATVNYTMDTVQVPLFIPSLGALQTREYDLYTGYAPDQTNLPILTGENGYVTTLDNAALEPASDFVITQSGYYASDRIGAFIYKANAFATYSNGAGSMKSSVLGADNNNSPTGSSDPDAAWTDEAKAYDGNTGTTAVTSANVAPGSYSSYLYLTRAGSDITGLRIWAATGGATYKVEIDAYDETWHNIVPLSVYNNAAWTTFSLPTGQFMAGNITQTRIRFYNGAGIAANFLLYEMTWTCPTLSASATVAGVAAGLRTIETTGVTAGDLTLTVGALTDTDPIAAVPNNANNWISMGGAWGYLSQMTMTIGVTEQLHYHPATMLIGTTVVDETNAYDGTITWGANPAGITVTIGAIESYAGTVSTIGADEIADTIYEATEPSGWFAAGPASTDLFFYDTFNSAATDLGVSTQTLYVIIILGLAAAIGASVFIFTGSLIFATAGVGIVILGGVSAGVLSVWMLFAFILLGVGVIYIARQV